MAYYHRFGEFIKLKIENMTIQHNETFMADAKKTAVVAVADGDGFEKFFKDLGVTGVARGGQSENISLQDLVDACRKTGSKDLIILPNNKNIVMTAEKVSEVLKDAVIHIVPTRSMAEGYLALSNIAAGDSADEMIKSMNEALNGVHTGLIAKADKTGVYNGISVTAGDYIGVLDDDVITCADKALDECLKKFMSTVPGAPEYKSVKIFSGNEEDKAIADGLLEDLKGILKSSEIMSCTGGQNIYNYVIAFS